ncbi:SOS response-associated peptidase [Amaricoccus tamworthensis]|uniref:SOS response-associated peptidase n=1 Tax=Amaricoccus tamworthensis TaxID=57002 RepID=UPI003C7DFB46
MCGRFLITSHFEAMSDLFGAVAGELGPDTERLNVSPTQHIPVVTSHDGERVIEPMRWGFLPHWYKAPNAGPLLINARSETIAEKPAFRSAVRERRCLIPTNGFYEWKGEKGAKTPYVIAKPEGDILVLAGVWQDWTQGNELMRTCAIVTCAANDTLSHVHHRMPVVIEPDDFGLWLGEDGHGAALLMVPADDDLLEVEEADERTREILKRRGG